MYLKLLLLTVIYNAKSVTSQVATTPDAYELRLIAAYGVTPDVISCCADYGETLYLTPYILNCSIDQAKQDALVDTTYFLSDIVSYSGYFTIDDDDNSSLFFWYFPAANVPEDEAPLILWIQGGPGASSAFGIFQIGPYDIDSDGNIIENPNSWAQNHSLLMIDGPAGSGFSFTNCDAGYATDAIQAGEQIYAALQQFYAIFTETQDAPLILAGTFYGAKLAITLGYAILQGNCSEDTAINLVGLALFDGIIEAETQLYHSGYGLETGLIDDATADTVEQLENSGADEIGNGNLTGALYYYNQSFALYLDSANLPNPYSFVLDYPPNTTDYIVFLQRPEIRSALHIGCIDLTILGEAYSKLQLDIYCSGRYWLEELLYNYKVMFVNGVLSPFTPYYASNYFYNSLDFDGAEDFQNATREFYTFNDTVVGYYRETTEVIQLVVRNSGNLLGEEKNAQVLAIISSFAENQTLSTTPSSSC